MSTTTKPTKADEAAVRILGPLADMLERGELPPWAKPWRALAGRGQHISHATGNPYQGANILFLEISRLVNGFESTEWITYKAAKKAGGQVRKGEKGTHVSLYKRLVVPDEEARAGGDADAVKGIPLLRSFVVFSLDQVDGIEPRRQPEDLEEPAPFEPIEAAARILEDYQGSGRGPSVSHGGDRAFYVPALDAVTLPDPDAFTTPAAYYATAYHEHGHGTGHASRLARPGITQAAAGPFGTEPYALEELVAETCAAILCGVAGIEGATIENQAAYCRGWLQRVKENPRAFVSQAGRGIEAARYILGEDNPRQADRDAHEAAQDAARKEEPALA